MVRLRRSVGRKHENNSLGTTFVYSRPISGRTGCYGGCCFVALLALNTRNNAVVKSTNQKEKIMTEKAKPSIAPTDIIDLAGITPAMAETVLSNCTTTLPFKFNLHEGDLSHSFVMGVTGQAAPSAVPELAYIAVTKTGFVDGACFTESPDAGDWVKEQERLGMTIKRLPRSEAKLVLYTQLEHA